MPDMPTMTTDNPWPLAELLETGEFSDFTLICQGEEFRLHKAVVCPQSPVMKAAIAGGFQVSIAYCTISSERLWEMLTVRVGGTDWDTQGRCF